MSNFQDIFDTCKRSFISDFSVCMTVTLRNIDITLVSLLSTFHTFSYCFILKFWELLPAGFTSRNQSTEK